MLGPNPGMLIVSDGLRVASPGALGAAHAVC